MTRGEFAAGGSTAFVGGLTAALFGPETCMVLLVLILMAGATALVVLEEIEGRRRDDDQG
jgi:hypothetical protein